MSFTLSNFKKVIPADIVKNGELTFKQGGVKKIDCNKNNEWVAEVTIGSEVFNVEIMIDDEKNVLDHFCDCPSETEHCRHQVATFLKIKEVLPAIEQKKAKAKTTKKEVVVKKKKLSPVDAILEEVSLLELHEFIRKTTTDNKIFKNTFFVYFADKNESNDRKYYSEVLRSTITSIKRNGYLNSRDSKRYLQTTQELSGKATDAFNAKRYKDFAPIGLAMIETLIPQLQRLEDPEYKFRIIIKNILKQFEESVEKAPYDIKTPIFKEFFDVLATNLSQIHSNFRNELLEVWKKISQESDLVNIYIDFLDKQKQRYVQRDGDYWSYSSFGGEITLETDLVDLKRAYFEANKMESYVPSLLAQHLHVSRYQKEHIEYLFRENKHAEAKKILEKILLNKGGSIGGVDVFLLNKLDEANEKLGDIPGTIQALLQRFRFGDYKQMSVLDKVKKLQTKAQWEETFELLVKEITTKTQRVSNYYGFYSTSKSTKTPIGIGKLYASDERWEQLEKMVYKNDDLESYATFCEYLLLFNFDKTFKFIKENLLEWIKKMAPSEYTHVAIILLVLQNGNKTSKDFADIVVHNIQTYHKGKKAFFKALKDNGVIGF
jgi:hypothetical protein